MTEKTVISFLFFFFLLGGLGSLFLLNKKTLLEVPVQGGIYTEGMVSSPRFINPVLVTSQADKDITSLVFSGLMRLGANGNLQEDLAESYSISEDGKIYTFVLKENILFHDEQPITAHDVVFTINRIQDPALKSKERLNWEGVIAEAKDDRTVIFTLNEAFAPFIYNTTIGILPSHLWEQAVGEEFSISQLNIEPIGSGPYQIRSIARNSSGITTSYHLVSFDTYTPRPFLDEIILYFFANREELIAAVKNGSVDAAVGLTPEEAITLKEANFNIRITPSSRVFALFFNHDNNALLQDEAIRKALSLATNREDIISKIFNGYASVPWGPFPKETRDVLFSSISTTSLRFNQQEAASILEKDGWAQEDGQGVRKKTEGKSVKTLSFKLATPNSTELIQVAEMIKSDWEKIGAELTIEIYEPGTLQQNIIRPRLYDMLLFGTVINHDRDLFAFWHSSGVNDPGLNIARFASIKTDQLLAAFRKERDLAKQNEIIQELVGNITSDFPAIFVYTPDIISVQNNRVTTFYPSHINELKERFTLINEWYEETAFVWKIFVKK